MKRKRTSKPATLNMEEFRRVCQELDGAMAEDRDVSLCPASKHIESANKHIALANKLCRKPGRTRQRTPAQKAAVREKVWNDIVKRTMAREERRQRARQWMATRVMLDETMGDDPDVTE